LATPFEEQDKLLQNLESHLHQCQTKNIQV